jgi:hypothetical protein
LTEKLLLLESIKTTFGKEIKFKSEFMNKVEICETSKLKIDSNDSMIPSSIKEKSMNQIDDNKINKILDELVNLVKLKSSSKIKEN